MVVRAKRGKPRTVHVRTGCLTCKSRKVKCSEEKPTCARCDNSGFVCRGYAVPKPWIFEPCALQKQKQKHNASLAQHDTRTTAAIPSPLLPSILTHGNSDPFHVFAIQIGPADNYYFKWYSVTIIPQLYTIQNRQWMSALAFGERSACFNSLEDEAAAYSLLARNAAVHSILSESSSAALSTTVLTYQNRAHAALRKKLSSLDDVAINDDAVMHHVLRTTYLLATTDILLKRPSATMHLAALRQLFLRYSKSKSTPIERAKFLFPFYVDIQYASMTLSRPMFDIITYFPEIEHFDYSRWHVPDKSLSHHVHSDVEDNKVRRMVMVKREGQYIHRDLNDHIFGIEDLRHVSFALHSRNIWFQTVILNIALDALDELQNLKNLGSTDYVSNTRAFIAIAVLHWGRFASVFPVAGKLLYDEAPVTIPLLRALLLQHESFHESVHNSRNVKPYTHARFWALFVGAQAEQNRSDYLGLAKVSGDWFPNAFQAQARAMGVTSWEEAVSILQQFLYSDHLKPHISTWWQ